MPRLFANRIFRLVYNGLQNAGWLEKVSNYQESSLNRIKNRQ